MYRPFLLILLTGLLAYCFSQNTQQPPAPSLLAAYKEADKLYTSAEKLSAADETKANEQYQLSLIQFAQLIPSSKSAGYDSLTFFLYLKSAAINYSLDSTAAATKNYLAAISIKEKLPAISDSLLFIPIIYTGRIYHSENQFDSASLFYNKAEQLNEKYDFPLYGSQLLYDRLATLNQDMGLYRQAKIYLEKAIQLLPPNTTASKEQLLRYKMMIASGSLVLEDHKQVQSIYDEILPFAAYNNEIYLKLGNIKLQQESYAGALSFFRKANFEQNKRSIDWYSSFGRAYSGMGEADSADLYFHKAFAENLKWNGHRANFAYGTILKYQADELVRLGKLSESLVLYQQALSQFDNNFSEKDIYKNPTAFNGLFSYTNLFNTLVAKANALEQLYQEEKQPRLLETSLQTYQSAFQLAQYVAKTYNSDESRLFLSKVKQTVQVKPIETALLLYQLTNQRKYLEAVYELDQQEKAINLLLAVQKNKPNYNSTPLHSLLKKEFSFQSNITRLSIKAATLTDSTQLSKLAAIIKNNETELNNIQEQLDANDAWQLSRTTAPIPSVAELQKKLDNTSALLSFHLSESELLTLFISASQFEFRKTPVNKKFFNTLKAFRSALQNSKQGQLYNGTAVAKELYNTIIGPLKHRLARINRIIIIPGDELSNLPLEPLQDEKGNYLVEKFSLQYQYSTAMLGKNIDPGFSAAALAFAPFAGGTATDSSGNSFTSLPASKEEIDKLEGKIFMDTAATKKNFMENVNRYGILHLATHTTINNEDPLKTFIAFNPVTENNQLSEQEIAGINLDSTDLVILSASRSNTGMIAEGKGLISLSRTFAYAGCPNMIASLWKGEDKVTALITQRLHYYLDQKFSKDKALQQAKLDLLRSNEIEPGLKTPDHWAHLVFIGTYQPDHEKNNWWWVAIGIIGIMLGFFVTKKKK